MSDATEGVNIVPARRITGVEAGEAPRAIEIEIQTDESVLEVVASYVDGQFIVRTSDGREFSVGDLRELQALFPRLQRVTIRGVRAPCVTLRGTGTVEIIMADGECGSLSASECTEVFLDNVQLGSCSAGRIGGVWGTRLTCGTFVGSQLDVLSLKGANMVLRREVGRLNLTGVGGCHLGLEGTVAEVNLGNGVRFSTIDGPGRDPSWVLVQCPENKNPENPGKGPRGKSHRGVYV
jgi:hypothetical protein